jgi:hypothetical protein
MKGSNRMMLALLAGVLIIGIIATGFYLYNKGPVDVKNASAKKIDASELYKAFSMDSLDAQKNFSGKVLEVKGKVEGISSNQQLQKFLLLNTGEEGAFVNCTLEETDNLALVKGDIVSVKGICKGLGEADPELGIKADLYLTRVYLK